MLEILVRIAIGIVIVVAGTIFVGWAVGFIKCLWEHYPEIKAKINSFFTKAGLQVKLIFDKIENTGYQSTEYVLKCLGIEKEKIVTITEQTFSLAEMKAMGYNGGDHFEQVITTQQ